MPLPVSVARVISPKCKFAQISSLLKMPWQIPVALKENANSLIRLKAFLPSHLVSSLASSLVTSHMHPTIQAYETSRSSQDVPLLPSQSGIFSPTFLATGQFLLAFANFAEVNHHQNLRQFYVIHLWHLLALPATSTYKVRPMQRTGCCCLGNSQYQPIAGSPAGFTVWLLVDFWLVLLATLFFLKDSPRPWSCLSPGPLYPFSLFLLILLTLKC